MNTKTIVMSRVRTIHALRHLVSAPAVSALVVVAALWGIGREVWVAKVIANMPSMTDVSSLAYFFFDAFVSTTFLVQLLTVATILGTAYAAREAAQWIGSSDVSPAKVSL